MPPDISLRSAVPADATLVAACVRTAYQHYLERIGKPPGPMLLDYAQVIADQEVTVAERNGTIVGILVLGEDADGFRLHNVAVDPSLRKTGLGRTFLQLAEAEARRRGHDSIHLSTHEKMTENQALYRKIGYVEYDRRIENGY